MFPIPNKKILVTFLPKMDFRELAKSIPNIQQSTNIPAENCWWILSVLFKNFDIMEIKLGNFELEIKISKKHGSNAGYIFYVYYVVTFVYTSFCAQPPVYAVLFIQGGVCKKEEL